MWNEEQFFKDLSQEMDELKPDKGFVKELTKLSTDDTVIQLHQRKKKKQIIKYAATAASLLLCFLVGGVGIFHLSLNSKPTPNTPSASDQINAQTSNEVITGSLENENKVPSSILSMIEDEQNLLDDETGVSLSSEERKELLSLLKQCVKTTKEADLGEINHTYYLVDNSVTNTTKIVIYDSFVKINEDIYKIIG